jgi:hypothetical protein
MKELEMTPISMEIQQQRQELDRLIYRRGDLATLREDAVARVEAIDRENGQVVGAIAAARTRIMVLEEQARNAPPAPAPKLEVVDAPAPAKGKTS